MVPTQRLPDQDPQLLLERVVARTRIGLDDGKSGTPIERLHLPDGTTVVVKHVRPYGDWIMRATHDAGRAVALWNRGTMDRVPSVIDHAVIGVVAEPDGWALVMRDVEHSLITSGRTLTRQESGRIIAALHALHTRFADANLAGLAPLPDRYTVLGPRTAIRERGGADAVPKLIERGWDLFAERVPRDVADSVRSLLDNPTELVTALARRRQTLVHGDLKVPNLGLSDGRVVLLDWGTMTGMAPSAVDWAWYLAISAGRISARREDILDDIRAAEGEAHDPVALSVSLLGSLLQLGWNKALDAFDHPDPAIRAREGCDLEWWVATARGVLDAWPLYSTTDAPNRKGDLTMDDITTRLAGVRTKLTVAVDAVEDDASASPVLVAVVREFDAKLARAEARVAGDTSHNGAVREAVVEAEQAADSAKVAAEADPSVGGDARQAVLDAHYDMCVLKAEM